MTRGVLQLRYLFANFTKMRRDEEENMVSRAEQLIKFRSDCWSSKSQGKHDARDALQPHTASERNSTDAGRRRGVVGSGG